MTYDLSNASFEEFLDFLFDHPVAAQHREENWGKELGKDVPRESAWYEDLGLHPWTQVTQDPNLTADYYIRLFTEPRILLQRYSRSEIDQGFALLPGLPIQQVPVGLGCLFVEKQVPLEKRLSVVRGLGPLHNKLLEPEGLYGAASGLWLTMLLVFNSAVEINASDRSASEEVRALRQGMFEVNLGLPITAPEGVAYARAVYHSGIPLSRNPNLTPPIGCVKGKTPSLRNTSCFFCKICGMNQ